MSRIGNKLIEIPKGVQITISPTEVTAKGPKGTHVVKRHEAIEVKQDAGTLTFHRSSEDKPVKAAHGLMRALVNNAIDGVTKGWERQLEINGVGYRAEVKGDTLVFQLGFSHPVEFKLPKGITAKVDKNVLVLAGIDKEAVGAAAAKIRSFRPPEPYKGKGVKYMEETILRKAGKAAGK
jgi:large subunit ribosomal protein L6